MADENKAPQTLDLDTLEPKGYGVVKLGGKEYKVIPPKVKQLAKLTRIAKDFEKFDKMKPEDVDPNDALGMIDELRLVLEPVMPGFKEDDVDLSPVQAGALLQYVMTLAVPEDQKAQIVERTKVTAGAEMPKDDDDDEKKSPSQPQA